MDNVQEGLFDSVDVLPQRGDISPIVDALRQEGGDNTEIEVKSARGGLPDSLVATLSAFANRPGGGTVILGLDEGKDFEAVGLSNASALAQSLADQARKALDPPITPHIEIVRFEGSAVVVAHVAELHSSLKPCRVRKTGKAHIRSFDGDHSISEQEEEFFRAHRAQPSFDRQPVPGTSRADLDPTLLALFLAEVRNQPSRLATMSDDEILIRKNVYADDHATLTLAGLYALGTYPQQYIPALGITASAAPSPGLPLGTRSQDIAYIDGSVPDMLDVASAWIRRNSRARVQFGREGQGAEIPEYPEEAIRELLANALVHRDIGSHAQSTAVNLRLLLDRLVLANPGGLFGLTIEQLGHVAGGRARNPVLYEICKYVRTRSGMRVIEAIGSGITAARESLRAAGMTPPRFVDDGITFTVLVPNHTLLSEEDLAWLADLPQISSLKDAQRHALVVMRHGGTWSNRSYRTQFAVDSVEARNDLANLVELGLVAAVGERRARTYAFRKGADLGAVVEGPQPVEEKARRQVGTKHADVLLGILADGPMTMSEMTRRTGLTPRQVAYALRQLRDAELVRLNGSQGSRDATYSVEF